MGDDMAGHGLSSWFGVPQHDVFAHQQIPLEKGKLHDSDMHSATMQLIKAQAYEISDRHNVENREIKQFNLISLTEGEFVAFDFNDGADVEAIEIPEQVSMTSYKIDNCDQDSRVIYLTKRKFEEDVSRFTQLHELNAEFFINKENEFRNEAVFDWHKLAVHSEEFISNLERYIWDCARHHRVLPDTPLKLSVKISVESHNPIVEISSSRSEILDVARSSDVKKRIYRDIQFFWGHEGHIEINTIKIS